MAKQKKRISPPKKRQIKKDYKFEVTLSNYDWINPNET